MFLTGEASCINELPAVIMKYKKNTIHNSTKMKPIDASKKSNEKEICSNLRDDRVKKPKNKLGQLVRTSDIRSVFSKGDSTNCIYAAYAITEVIRKTIPSYGTNFLPERYNENLLRSTNLSLDENSKVMKELNLIQ